jgi:hypothetical protein
MKSHLADEHLTKVYSANQTQLSKYDRNCIFKGFVLNHDKSNQERLDFFKKVICRHIPSEEVNFKWVQQYYQVELTSNLSSITSDNYSKNTVISQDQKFEDIFLPSPLETIYDNQLQNNIISGFIRILGNSPFSDKFCKLLTATIGTKIQHGTIMEGFIFQSFKGHKAQNVSIKSVLNEISRNPNVSQFYNKVEFLAKLIIECDEEFNRTTKLVVDFIFYCSVSKVIYVFENKDGGELDTKNMNGNIEEVKMTARVIQVQIKANNLDLVLDQVKSNLVMFSKEQISKSIISKVRGSEEFIITGRQFCKITGISYEEVEALSEEFNKDNISFVAKKVEEMRQFIPNM